MNYLSCQSGQGHKILMGHVSLLGANPSPTSLCLELISWRRAADSQGVWLGASEERLWGISVLLAWALPAALEESDGARASVWSTAIPSGPAPGGLCSL